MKKKFQITSTGKTKVIVRIKDESGKEVAHRDYRNLTWATSQRLDQLTYNDNYTVHTVTTPRSADVFIQERKNG